MRAQAFGVSSFTKAKTQQQRNLDRAHKKETVDVVDRTPDVPPPVLIGVMGPPGSGKTTLIKVGPRRRPARQCSRAPSSAHAPAPRGAALQSLVKKFTRHNLVDVRGPITVVSGKKRRLTFVECPNTLTAMLDVAKVADLVLLLIDGSFGFEMETFEFLNMLQVRERARARAVRVRR